jgi:hypothetical protein
MAYTVTFKQKEKMLFKFNFDVVEPDHFTEMINRAHEEFLKQHPGVLLFDDVTVIYDKE